MNIRASSIPRLLDCPGSQSDGMQINETSDDAELGTAIHYVIAKMIQGEDSEDEISRNVKVLHGVDRKDIYYYVMNALSFLNGLKEKHHIFCTVSEPSLSANIGEHKLSGHPDVIATGDDLHIIDWKFSNIDIEKFDQLKAYAYLWLVTKTTHRSYEGKIYLHLYSVMDNEYRTIIIKRDEIKKFSEEVLEALESQNIYKPSPVTCRYCPLKHTCAARKAALNSSIEAVTGYDIRSIIMQGKVIELMDKAKDIERLVNQVKKDVNLYLDEFGPIVENGYCMSRTAITRRDIDLNNKDSFLAASKLIGGNGMINLLGKVSLKKVVDEYKEQRKSTGDTRKVIDIVDDAKLQMQPFVKETTFHKTTIKGE